MSVKLKASTIGFILGLILIVGANLYDYEQRPLCLDCFLRFGVPFKMWGTGGIGPDHFYWSGLIANALTWFIFSSGLGFVFQLVAEVAKIWKSQGDKAA